MKRILYCALSILFCTPSYADNPCGYECTQNKVATAIAQNPALPGEAGEAGAQGEQGDRGDGGLKYGCTGSNLGECKVFLTSNSYKGNLSTTDTFVTSACALPNTSADTALDKANCICGVEGARISTGRWRAWLSTTTTNASININYNPGATYIRPDGTIIASAGGLLFNPGGNLTNPVTDSGGFVLTGTNSNGTFENFNCTNWTSETSGGITLGSSTNSTFFWTFGTTGNCADARQIYCFEAASDANPA